MPADHLSLTEARRLALAAQGFARPRPAAPAFRDVAAVIDRLAVLQIDSVNVVERAHFLPLFSRLGSFDRALFERASARPPRRALETWAHEASFVRPDVYHLMEWRRHDDNYLWGRMRQAATHHNDVVARVRRLLDERGAMTASQIQVFFQATHPKQPGKWWNWSVAKAALEYLFFRGEVASAGRSASFERRYDLAERVLPPAPPGLPADDPGRFRALVEIAARAQGVATAADLTDYFRLPRGAAEPAIADLETAGALWPVTVQGWRKSAWRHRDAAAPRPIEARALLVPFDPLVFNRPRLEALFGFRFRLEYYLPKDKRLWGYYVMPFLLGDRLAARVDLKADRPAGRLLVHAAYLEPELGPDADVGEALAAELRCLADWLGLDEVAWDGRWTKPPEPA
ncbi:MAG: winged helix DNA-binding domain-containing protein [Propionibacteriaceae bacterium]|jgi:uncharacterized protein YcaQ|nr:winged helix DNA-binding domain-containing protein [Propionibacteriaceae bacterium]